MIETLINIDTHLFLLLNGCHNAFFDIIMYWASSKWIWVPFYAVLAYLIIREYKWKSLYLFIAVALLIVLTDQVSVHCFKNVFHRLRPTHNPEIQDLVHTINGYRGGLYGFVSSHAASVFGLAVFLSTFLRRRYPYFPILIFLWAALVAYSRIYLGVHYPGDVLCGALFGCLLGYLISFILLRLFHFQNKISKPPPNF